MRAGHFTQASYLALAAGFLSAPMPVLAEDVSHDEQQGASQLEQVIVTARKREESDISVPVSITAYSAKEIERQAVFNIFDVALRTPALFVNNNTSGTGGNVYLRGVGTSANVSSTIEQSVVVSIDGVPISRGNALRVGQYDLDQIEILKGPQALFFGKNSPAGVISVKSKDPTSKFETSAKLSYEPYANDRFAELAVSGPLTDSLRARLFVHADQTDGDNDNLSALALPANAILPGSVMPNPYRHGWASNEYFGRGTVVFEPNDRFKARLMTSYEYLHAPDNAAFEERFYCPQGRPQTGAVAAALYGFVPNPNTAALANALAVDDCKLNHTTFFGGINPALLKAPSVISHDAGGVSRNDMSISAAELTYKLTDSIDLASVSGFARLLSREITSFAWAPAALSFLTYYNRTQQTQFTQELRATSHFAFPLNFMFGGFYQDATFETYAQDVADAPFNIFKFHIPNRVYSVFGQGLWDIVPQVELAAGVRLTREKRSLLLTRDGVPQPVADPTATFDNASPEATLSWRPTSDLTAYVGYKTGFKSGNYAATVFGNGPPLPAANPMKFLFRPERAKGFEGGVKTALLDGTLRIDATVYSYEYSDLQVASPDASNPTALVLRVLNAATARQRGVEIDASYHPLLVSGLRLNGSVNYNDSYYTTFLSPCYIGQSIAEGCDLLRTPDGASHGQSLAGQHLPNAPLWVGTLGFSYARPIIGNMRLEFGAEAAFRSSYDVTADHAPGGIQSAYTELSSQMRLMSEDGVWELGIYGKNLTDVLRAQGSYPFVLTGNSGATGTVNGGRSAWADLVGSPNPGRAVFFQVMFRM
jgi:iron complex outermembrane recepter protein